jgi:hypothetical protein
MTQVHVPEPSSSLPEDPLEEPEFIEKTIGGERRLHQLIQAADGPTSIEKLILQTQFEERYFENYQEQLAHLRVLAAAAVNPASVAKITDIRRKICRDVCA